MKWLVTSGQLWKLYVAGLLGLVSLGLSCAPGILLGAADNLSGTQVEFIGIGLAALIPIWIAWSVRCPSCGVRSFGAVRRRTKFTHIAEEFLALDKCPECQYPNK